MSLKSPFLRHPWLNHPFVPKLLVCFFEGYSFASFRKDLIAGITVGIIALPLAMAFAIAAGVEPSRGLYTAVVAGFIISLLGGSRIQIGGPTGAFVVIIYSVLERHGYNGLVVATLMAGILLLLMGLFRVGRLIRFVPYPLIIGFTTGLALLIFTAQIKDFFGLTLETVPSDFFGKWVTYASHLSTIKLQAFGVGAFSLAIILSLRRFVPKAPWGITAIILSTLLVSFLGLDVETIGKRYGELPHSLPGISFPNITWDLSWFQALLPDALAIAILAGLESLLSALMGDSMIGGKHKSDCELMAQAFGNIGSVLFGGIPATGAISRTAANIKVGARTPVAGLIHALTLLAIMGLCTPVVGKIPLAALSSVLIVVAWNMAELHRFVHLFLKAPRGDIAVMLTAFALTVIVDLSFAIQMSMLLALFLFMKRVSEKQGQIHPLKDKSWKQHDSVEVYDIQGPLFFGVADRVRDLASTSSAKSIKYFVLRMQGVPILDASGLNALSELLDRCRKSGIKLLLAEIHADTHQAIEKFGLLDRLGKENLFEQVQTAIETAHGEIQANIS